MNTTSTNTSDLRILLVEDTVQASDLMKNMLVTLGYTQVSAAKDGVEALELLGPADGERRADIILCDWNMPRISGFELLKKIRSYDPDLPFIMITGNADQDSVAAAKSYDVTGYLEKPFSQNDLEKKLNTIKRIIQHRRQSLA